MRAIDELDHYEMLEVAPGASQDEIDRAYRVAQQVYSEGSLAVYSIFGNADVVSIRSRIDEAYGVLADPETRDLYDRERAERATEEPLPPSPPAARDVGPVSEAMLPFESYDPLEDDGDEEIGGVRLRRVRLFRGYELDDISQVTKVSCAHLRNIEEENFGDLPADVYVRGFVTAYAKTIGLDPEVVAAGYMVRMQQARREGSRSRLLGRR